MARDMIIHTVSVNGDGSGDLVYFLHWLKVFTAAYTGCADQHVIISARKYQAVKASLIDLQIAEPSHPIFNYLKICDGNVIAQTKNNLVLGAMCQTIGIFDTLDIKGFFGHVTKETYVTVFKISQPVNLRAKDLKTRSDIEKIYHILEFDGAMDFMKSRYFANLGLGDSDLGLLHDIDGVTGTENIDELVNNLPIHLKQLLFQDTNIATAKAVTQLAEIPRISAYLSPLCDSQILDAIFDSAVMQKAIEADQKPLVLISGDKDDIKLSSKLLEAAKQKQIRLITAWIPTKDHKALSAIFMHKDTNSMIVPSGDNTLTLCVKTGKFPFYAHKVAWAAFAVPDSKYGLCKSILNIVKRHGDKGWQNHPGYHNCKLALAHVCKPIAQQQYAHLSPLITPEMLAFFRDIVSPYIMCNYAFEKKTLPRILDELRQSELQRGQFKTMTTAFQQTSAEKSMATPKPAANAADKHEFKFRKGFLNNS